MGSEGQNYSAGVLLLTFIVLSYRRYCVMNFCKINIFVLKCFRMTYIPRLVLMLIIMVCMWHKKCRVEILKKSHNWPLHNIQVN